MELPYRLLALDLDGTLLDPKGEVSPATARAVAAARAAGIQVVLASGRAPRHITDIHRRLDLATPIVAHDGAVVYDRLRRRVVHHEPLDLDVARRLAALLKEHDQTINLHVESQTDEEDRRSVEAMDERLLESILLRNAESPHSVGAVQQLLADEATRISKLWFYAPPDTMAAIKRRLLAEFRDQVSTLAFDDVTLSVLSTGASKAAGVAWVAERLGVARAEVAAIGDELNDVPMLGWAGLGIAMGNAKPCAREVAKVVTAANGEDGVARAIERWLLGENLTPPAPLPLTGKGGDAAGG